MTDPMTFHFAVKPGCEPVQLPSLSAHSAMPWVAKGYGCFTWVYSPNAHFEKLYMIDGDREKLYSFCSVELDPASRMRDGHFWYNPVMGIYEKVSNLILAQTEKVAS